MKLLDYFVGGIGTAVCLLCFSAYGAQSGVVPAEVEVALKQYSRAWEQICLECKEVKSGADVPDTYGGATKYFVAYNENRVYLRTEVKYRGQSQPSVHEDGFDGTNFFYGDLSERPGFANPSVLKKYLPGDSSDPESNTPIIFDYPELAGVSVARQIADCSGFNKPESLVSRLANESVSTHVVVGTEKKIIITFKVSDPLVKAAQGVDLEARRRDLETTTTAPEVISKHVDSQKRLKSIGPELKIVVTLDGNVGYGIIAREDFNAEGKKIRGAECKNWEFYSSKGVWLPKKCVQYRYYSRFEYDKVYNDPQIKVEYELGVVRFEADANQIYNLEESEPYRVPGTLIADRSTPAARENRSHQVNRFIGVDGRVLRIAAESELPEIVGRRKRFWAIALITIFALPIALAIRRIVQVRGK